MIYVPAYKNLKVSWWFTTGWVMMPKKYIHNLDGQPRFVKIDDTCHIPCWLTNCLYSKGEKHQSGVLMTPCPLAGSYKNQAGL